MNTKEEALKMAINFMETLTIDVGIKTWNEKSKKEAIQACKEALEQHSGDVVVTKNEQGQIVCVTRQDAEGNILSVIAESEQPEVGDAEIKQMLNDIDWYQMRVKELEEELEALEQPAQEPVAWMKPFEMKFIEEMKQRGAKEWATWLKAHCSLDDIALYTHPTPSWVGLSDDEISKVISDEQIPVRTGKTANRFARAIEQALKEKNKVTEQ